MPELCRFDGIVIRMFPNDHPPPQIHAVYGEYAAKFDIANPDNFEGRFPARERRKVRTWALERQAELLASWNRAVRNRPAGKIAPLRG